MPHVFFDGHSIILSRGESSSQSYQMTRPYIYHARGIQDLKNFAGQTLANYLQNQVQHKFIVMKEAIPQEKDYTAALTNPQRASTLVVNAFYENNPDSLSQILLGRTEYSSTTGSNGRISSHRSNHPNHIRELCK